MNLRELIAAKISENNEFRQAVVNQFTQLKQSTYLKDVLKGIACEILYNNEIEYTFVLYNNPATGYSVGIEALKTVFKNIGDMQAHKIIDMQSSGKSCAITEATQFLGLNIKDANLSLNRDTFLTDINYSLKGMERKDYNFINAINKYLEQKEGSPPQDVKDVKTDIFDIYKTLFTHRNFPPK